MYYIKKLLKLSKQTVPEDILKAYSLALEANVRLEKQNTRVGRQNVELAYKITQLEDEIRQKDRQITCLQTRLRVDKSFLMEVA